MRTGPLATSPARGSVLIVALLITALIALALGSYLSLNLSTSRLSRQSYQRTAAFNLAEAGAEEALWSFNQANAGNTAAWADWNVQPPAAWRKFGDFSFGGNTSGSVKVYVSKVSPSPYEKPNLVALASVSAPGTPVSTSMLQMTLSRRSYFASGLVAANTIRFNGLNTTIDSWNSDPDNNPATPPIAYSPTVRNDHGSVATLAVQNGAMLINQASIWGYVATGGSAPQVGSNGSIRGASTPAGVQIDPARVSTDFSANLPAVAAPLDGTVIASVGATLGTVGQTTKWRCPYITLRASQTLTILGNVTLTLTAATGSALDMTGNASIIIPAGSSLTLYVEGDMKIAGNGLANSNIQPASCLIWGTGAPGAGQSIQIAGNGTLQSAIYAPNADVTINGNGDVMGAVVGLTITFNGNANFHYDESLLNYGTNTPFKATGWRELDSEADQSAWLPVFSGW